MDGQYVQEPGGEFLSVQNLWFMTKFHHESMLKPGSGELLSIPNEERTIFMRLMSSH